MRWPFGSEKTPSGGTVIRHRNLETRRGFPEVDTRGFLETREGAYKRLFGEAIDVSHEIVPLVPHVDVYRFKGGMREREMCTLVTGGMSDLPMTMPRGAGDAPRRVELIFYCDEGKDEYIATLRWLAHFPHDARSWLGAGHTVPNGNPPSLFWGSDSLDTILFMPPIVNKHQRLSEDLVLGGDPVHFLWVVPLTTAECNFKLDRGFGALLDLFAHNQHPPLFDRARKSYL